MERGDSISSPITPAVCKGLRGIFQRLPSNDDAIYFINATEQTSTALPLLNILINPCFTPLSTSSSWAKCLAGSRPGSSRLSASSGELRQMLRPWVSIPTPGSWKDINPYKWSVVKKAELIWGRRSSVRSGKAPTMIFKSLSFLGRHPGRGLEHRLLRVPSVAEHCGMSNSPGSLSHSTGLFVVLTKMLKTEGGGKN